MTRSEYVAAALALAGENVRFKPVQVQKYFFILDREVPDLISGPQFEHGPYDYGPYDREVYTSLEKLASEGLLIIDDSGRYKEFSLSSSGYEQGLKLAENLPDAFKDYASRLSNWLIRLSFAELVSAVYKKYPEMREKSIFQG